MGQIKNIKLHIVTNIKVREMLVKLPIEILEHVLFYCDIGDKRNISCCSKTLNTMMEPLLWRTVYMKPALLATTWHNGIFNKFRHTRTLNFYPSNEELLVQTRYHTTQPSTSAVANFGYNLAKVLDAVDSHQVTKLIVSFVVSDDSFKYIMEKLCFVEHLELSSLSLAKRTWEKIPAGLTQLTLSGYVTIGHCNITDDVLKGILEKNQLNRLECDLNFHEERGVTELTSKSLWHISRAESIKELKISFYIPPALDLCCLSDMWNLTSLQINGNIPLVDDEKFMFQICEKLQQLQILVLGGLHINDKSFSKIHMLSSLKKLTIETMEYLSACFIFHYIKNCRTLCEFSFDGWSFVELKYGEELTDDRKEEIYKDIRVLNHMPKLSKITVDCHDEYDISQIVIEGLCERKQWIHEYVHTFYNTFC